MARRRTLAPEFFSDEDISSLPFEARLLYAGLWCYADRDGRLEDRPKYLKAMIFPYDRVDVEKLLNLLASPQCLDRPTKVFIHRYVIDDRNYLEIPEFTKHQSPHHTEHHSRIPAFNGVLTVRERLEVSKVQDAHYPISDPISDQRPETRTANNDHPPGWGTPEALVALYNTESPDECPAVDKLTDARRKKAKIYLAQFPDRQFWLDTFKRIHESTFLRGLKAQTGHEHFRASLDWLLTKGKDGVENVVKTWEGRYSDG